MRRERRGELLGELRAELAARVRGLRPRVVEAHRALRDGLLALEAVEQRPREADLEPVQVLVGRVEAVPRLGESLTRGAVGSEEGRPIRRARCPYGRRGGALLSGGLGDRRGPLQRGPTQAVVSGGAGNCESGTARTGPSSPICRARAPCAVARFAWACSRASWALPRSTVEVSVSERVAAPAWNLFTEIWRSSWARCSCAWATRTSSSLARAV